MNTIGKISSSALLGALMMAGALSIAPAAQAASGWDRCPHGSMCVFSEGNGQGGGMAVFNVGSPDLGQQGLDNHVGSFWNRSGKLMKLWDGYNYTGDNLGSSPTYSTPINQAGISSASSVSGT